MLKRYILLGLFVYGFLWTGTWADEESMLRREMTTQEWEASGLGKLSAAELRALETWLARRLDPVDDSPSPTPAKDTTATQVSPPPSHMEQRVEEEVARRVAELRQADQEQRISRARQFFGLLRASDDEELVGAIESRIPGRFTGWEGNTIFRLENGQVWRQRHPGRYFRPMQDPVVLVERRGLGYWLVLKETGARIGVTRVE